jgi:hypothetical protein
MNLGTWFSIGRILFIKGTRALHGGCFAMLLEQFGLDVKLCQACQETRR